MQARAPLPCHDWARKLPGVSEKQCRSLNLIPSGQRSVKGYPIEMRDVGQLTPRDSGQRRVLIIGGIHGDELSASALALAWTGFAITDARQADAIATHWRFVPTLNPDGLLARPATRTNAHGVDLNRNFPTPNWQQEAPAYWTERTKKDKRRFPGTAPLSEPESRFISQQIEQYAPNLIVSIHAPFGVLDFDGPPGEGYVPPSQLGKLYLDRVGVYPGSLGNYAGVNKGIPVVTIELPHALRAPSSAETRQMWLDLKQWMDTQLAAHIPR